MDHPLAHPDLYVFTQCCSREFFFLILIIQFGIIQSYQGITLRLGFRLVNTTEPEGEQHMMCGLGLGITY